MAYEPLNFGNADSFWANAMIGYSQNDQLAQGIAPSAYLQTFQNQQNIDYTPFLEGAKNMGSMYQGLADLSGQQMDIFGQQAQSAFNMEGMLQGASGQLLYNAFQGPQTENIGNQINQGMAQRGITDAALYNQGIANFKMDWKDQSVGWQSMALNAASQASNAWTRQAGVYSGELQNQMTAGQNQISYTGFAADIPLQAQQYVAWQPAANANQFVQNMAYINQMWSGQATAAQNYISINYSAEQQKAKTEAINQLMDILSGGGGGNTGDSIGDAVSAMHSDPSIPSSAIGKAAFGYGISKAGMAALAAFSPQLAAIAGLVMSGYSAVSTISGWLGFDLSGYLGNMLGFGFDSTISDATIAGLSSFGGLIGGTGVGVGDNDGGFGGDPGPGGGGFGGSEQ